ncbi:MAG: hypothetical protein ACQKBV_04990 [Puniceicoccales bacterium]
MPRPRTNKSLPQLAELIPDFQCFPKTGSRQTMLTEHLRDKAATLQQDSARPFYSMREVSSFFNVPLRTTALAYEALDLEGLLHRIRGSQTMLVGKKPQTRHPINAIVGLPIWLQSMITSPFECRLQMEMEELLRNFGYVADSIFYRSREDFEPNFSERLLRHKLDLLIWNSPHPLSSHVLMSLRERGMRLILLQSKESILNIPARTHLLDWQPAYEKMIATWQEQGIQRVVSPHSENLLARRAIRRFKRQVENAGMEFCEIEEGTDILKEKFLNANTSKSVLAFLDILSADALCNSHPDLIEQVATEHRLAFCRGPVRVPRLTTRRIKVDLVELNPIDIAEKVVDDLRDPEQVSEGTRGTINAEYRPMQILSGLYDRDPTRLSI